MRTFMLFLVGIVDVVMTSLFLVYCIKTVGEEDFDLMREINKRLEEDDYREAFRLEGGRNGVAYSVDNALKRVCFIIAYTQLFCIGLGVLVSHSDDLAIVLIIMCVPTVFAVTNLVGLKQSLLKAVEDVKSAHQFALRHVEWSTPK